MYNNEKNDTIIYGQYKNKISSIHIEGLDYEVVFCNTRPDFYIKIANKVSYIKNIIVHLENTSETINDLFLLFPFENYDLQLDLETSTIISTMCQKYSHRLDELIQYNLHLGFSGIVIFNNDKSSFNCTSELAENGVINDSIKNICKKYKGKVWIIDYPYTSLTEYWDPIQRISLSIGVNEFKNKCRNIALIDADEFIYIHKNPLMKIEQFLQEYNTIITMRSNILTNKNNNDILNNNILKLAKYIGEDKYTKTILQTDKINYLEFIVTPHDHAIETILEKNEIIHYHCWMNTRFTYDDSMGEIDISIPLEIYEVEK